MAQSRSNGLAPAIRAAAQQADINPQKVAIYIRWSTEDQGDGTTLEVQRRNCEMFVQSQGWYVEPDLVFIDEGFSGGTLDRPALNRLRRAITAGRIDCVVVYKLDRLSRSVLDTVNLVLDEWDGACHLKSATQPLDTRDPLGKQFFYMLVGFAEYERQMIKERTFSGKVTRASQGKNPGFFPPYGFTQGPEPGTFQVNPDEMEVVQRIFRDVLGGLGVATVCRALNSEGIPYNDHRTGKTTTWKETTIRYMLRNELYTGRIVYGKSHLNQRRKDGGPTRYRNEVPLVQTEAVIFSTDGQPLPSPPIDPAALREALRLMDARRFRHTSNRARVSEHLLTGIVRCSRCGLAMYGRKRQVSATGGTYSPGYYVCQGMRSRGTCGCGHINQAQLDAIVVDHLLRRYGTKVGRRQFIDAAKADTEDQIRQLETALTQAQESLRKADTRLEELRREYVDKRITLDEYREFKAYVEQESAGDRHRAGRLLVELGKIRSTQQSDAVLEQLSLRLDAWESLTVEEKKALLAEFIVAVRVYRDRNTNHTDVDIAWRQEVGQAGIAAALQ